MGVEIWVGRTATTCNVVLWVEIEGTGGYVPGTLSLTLKSRGTSYVLVPPQFYHTIYFYWLVPPTYKMVPAPLIRGHNPYTIINIKYNTVSTKCLYII